MAAIQFNPVAGPQGGVGASGAAPTLGLTGGIATAGAVKAGKDFYQDGMDASFGIHPDFLNDVFAAPLAAAKQERVWKGFSDGVAGVTSEQVQKQQPWYTKLFGPTDYESGVTMYENQKKVSDLAMSWSARMPELRELPHEQVTEMLTAEMRNLQSDNPFANALLQKDMMQTFAPLIAQHGKERVAWKQSQLVKRQVGAAESRNAQFQAMSAQVAALGKDSPMQKEAAESLAFMRQSLMDVWSTGNFQNDESRKAFLMTAARSAARQGQFYVLEALRAEGFMDSLSAEDAERFEKQYETAQITARNRLATENEAFGKMIARANALSQMGVGGEHMYQMTREINDTYKAMTGSPLGYFNDQQMAQMAGTATLGALRRQERAEDKQFQLSLRAMDREEKEMIEERNNAEALQAFNNGRAGEALLLKNVEQGDIDRASMAQFNQDMQDGKPELAIGRVINNFANLKASYTNQQLRNQLQSNLQNSMDEGVNDAFMAQYGIWKQMYEGKAYDARGEQTDNAAGRAAAIGYYGGTINQKMVEFDRKLQQLGPERAYATTFGEWVGAGRPDFRGIERGDQKVATKAFISAVDAQGAGWFDRTFGNGYKLHPAARQQLSAAVAPYWEQLGDDLLPEHKAKAAIQLLLSENGGRAEVVGGQFMRYGRQQQPLTKWMNDPDGMRTNVLFATTLRDKAKAVGLDVDKASVSIVRLQDEGGVPQFSVQAFADDGYVTTSFTGADLIELENKGIKLAEQKRAGAIADTKAGKTGYGFQLPQETEAQFEQYHGMSREEFDERGRRNRQRIMEALPYVTIPSAALLRDATQ